jgi:hypothetical protein
MGDFRLLALCDGFFGSLAAMQGKTNMTDSHELGPRASMRSERRPRP